MARAVGDCHRPVGAFNPVWCLRPQTTGKGTTTRWLEYSSPTPRATPSTDTARGRRIQPQWIADASAEPPSPKVGCMGRVKERSVGGCGSPQVIRTKFQQLRRIFSGRSVPGSAAAASPEAKAEAGCSVAPRISIAELDPPLPVVRKVSGGSEAGSLWKRRCGEAPVPEGLQLRQQKPMHTHLLHQETSTTLKPVGLT